MLARRLLVLIVIWASVTTRRQRRSWSTASRWLRGSRESLFELLSTTTRRGERSKTFFSSKAFEQYRCRRFTCHANSCGRSTSCSLQDLTDRRQVFLVRRRTIAHREVLDLGKDGAATGMIGELLPRLLLLNRGQRLKLSKRSTPSGSLKEAKR